jgi:hypothetical protein
VYWLTNGNYGNTVGAVSLLGPRHVPSPLLAGSLFHQR